MSLNKRTAERKVYDGIYPMSHSPRRPRCPQIRQPRTHLPAIRTKYYIPEGGSSPTRSSTVERNCECRGARPRVKGTIVVDLEISH